MQVTKEEFAQAHTLSPADARQLYERLKVQRPEFVVGHVPIWWWWARCRRHVLVVTDGNLNVGMDGGGLSEFLKAFNALEAQSWVDWRVTTAHRDDAQPTSNNPVVVNHIHEIRFDQVDLSKFDQIWLFGIEPNGSLGAAEIAAINDFMDNGGGVFATGDHGRLGSALCGDIQRVKDMRYWGDFGNFEVGMTQARRNDTNQPEPGSAVSHYFDNQSDATPQTIAVRTFSGGQPHPLLSISPALRASRIIDIMPDHPHEGECKPETTFEVNGVEVPTQIIATSFVRGGNTTYGGGPGGKTPTEPHCFPSIAVWDGWKANAGRIVVDSTWHHFVNINLNGADTNLGDIFGPQPGLDPADWLAVRQYFMNIALWLGRRRIWWCWWRRLVFEMVNASQLVEASVEVTPLGPAEATLSDLHSIGSLAEELLGTRITPGWARSFLLEIIESGPSEQLAEMLEDWSPVGSKYEADETPHVPWLNLDRLLHTAIGGGFAAVRAATMDGDEPDEEELEAIADRFNEGAAIGLGRAIENLREGLDQTFEKLGG